MSKFSKATWGGLLFACWMMCFVFPYAVFTSFNDHTPIGAFLGQMLVDFLVLWLMCGVIAHGVIGMFDDLNNRGRRNNDPNDPNDPNGPANGGQDRGGKRPDDDKSDRDNGGDDQSRR